MIAFPPAKINLGLQVIEKRADGFHNLETVFYPIEWCDILEIVKTPEFNFSQSGLIIDGDKNKNLCVKAYDLLKQDFDLSQVHIYLHKIIPMGAGLGGGSSDAAYTLQLLNNIFCLNLSQTQLSEYAIRLGSDCAFFLNDKPLFAKGRGELLSPISVSLKNYFIALIMPSVNVSTAEAYQNIVPKKPVNQLSTIVQSPINEWKNKLTNDFETSVFKKYPIIKEIKEKLYASGAIYASMSGSGASVFGIFKEEKNLSAIFNDCCVWQGACKI